MGLLPLCLTYCVGRDSGEQRMGQGSVQQACDRLQ